MGRAAMAEDARTAWKKPAFNASMQIFRAVIPDLIRDDAVPFCLDEMKQGLERRKRDPGSSPG
jgi:hypothetical protein